MAELEAWWRWAKHWRLTRMVETCDRVTVLDQVQKAAHLSAPYAFMTVMSSGIATLGLLQNSVAVIIGAMLISPLMGPIIGLGMGLATFDLQRIREALLALLTGILLALAIAVLIVWLSPLKEATSEILARTEPTLFDLLVAVFSGLAGAYATVTRKGDTIVGVAIATALMPPLAVVGYGIAVGNWSIAGGASFLFMTNLLAIALSVTIIARLYGFGRSDSPKQTVWQAGVIIVSFALLSIPLGLALGRIAKQSQTEITVRTALNDATEKVSGRVASLRVTGSNSGVTVDAILLLPKHVSDLQKRLEDNLNQRLGMPVKVNVQEVLTSNDNAFTQQQDSLAELRRNVTALQSEENQRLQLQQTAVTQRTGMQSTLLPFLGNLQRSPDGKYWQFLLTTDARMTLEQAQTMETRINAAPKSGEPPLQVFPPLQPLPAILIADREAKYAGPDDAQRAQLSTQVWALQRWRAGATDVVIVTRDAEQATAWESLLRETLATSSIEIKRLRREQAGEPRVQLAVAAP